MLITLGPLPDGAGASRDGNRSPMGPTRRMRSGSCGPTVPFRQRTGHGTGRRMSCGTVARDLRRSINCFSHAHGARCQITHATRSGSFGLRSGEAGRGARALRGRGRCVVGSCRRAEARAAPFCRQDRSFVGVPRSEEARGERAPFVRRTRCRSSSKLFWVRWCSWRVPRAAWTKARPWRSRAWSSPWSRRPRCLRAWATASPRRAPRRSLRASSACSSARRVHRRPSKIRSASSRRVAAHPRVWSEPPSPSRRNRSTRAASPRSRSARARTVRARSPHPTEPCRSASRFEARSPSRRRRRTGSWCTRAGTTRATWWCAPAKTAPKIGCSSPVLRRAAASRTTSRSRRAWPPCGR